MALAFPKNPIEGQVYDYPPFRYQFTSGRWLTVGKGANTVSEAIKAHEAAPNIHSMAAIQWQGGLSHRNLLINGDFRVNQRAFSSVTLSNNSTYIADRWGLYTTASCYVRQYDGSESDFGNVGSLIAAQPSTTCSISFWQKIESVNARHLSGKKLTFSFEAFFQNGGGVGAVIARLPSSVDNFASTSNVGEVNFVRLAGTNRYSVTLPAITDARNGLQIEVVLPDVSGVFKFTKCQLELGEVATPFENRPYGYELSLCQRYFRNDFVMARTAPVNANVVTFPVRMRVAPTITKIGGAGSGATWSQYGGGKGIFQDAANSVDALAELAFDSEL